MQSPNYLDLLSPGLPESWCQHLDTKGAGKGEKSERNRCLCTWWASGKQ